MTPSRPRGVRGNSGSPWRTVLLAVVLWLPAALIVIAHLVAVRVLIVGSNVVFAVLWLAYILSYHAGGRAGDSSSPASRGILGDVRMRTTLFFVSLVVNMLVVAGAAAAVLMAAR